MSRITIYNSERSARRAAKADYADIFNCKPSSIHLTIYKGYYAPNSTRCVCGETTCLELQPTTMSKRQEKLWNAYKEANRVTRFFWYGVCDACGEKF